MAYANDRSRVHELLVRLEQALRRIDAVLDDAYGSPNLGNVADPTTEFVYIVLSRKTAERAYKPAFARLLGSGTWSEIARFSTARLVRILRGGGLERKKAIAIRHGLRAIDRAFGGFDLSRAGGLDDEALAGFLSRLPEVGPKSALCIMLYAFGRPTFPVDAHVGRVLGRLGVFESMIRGLGEMGHKGRQAALADAVPPDLRYRLHVNLIEHGRKTCVASKPRCGDCCLAELCKSGRAPARMGA